MVYRRSKRNIRRAPRRSGRPARSSYRKSTRYARPRRAFTSRQVAAKSKPCICPGELSPSAKFALAQLDPFEPRCQGAKVPDSNSMPSIANADTDQVVLSTLASQNQRAIAFWPSYRDSHLLSGIATGLPNIVSWDPAASGTPAAYANRRNFVAVDAAIEAIRPVAHAIRISSSLASTSATGFIHVALATESKVVSTSAPNVWQLPTTVDEMVGCAHYKRFTISSLTQSPITIINKWIDDTAFRYSVPNARNSPTSATSTFQTFDFGGSWGQLVVLVEGAPAASNVVSIEHLLLSEMLPKKDSFILGTSAAPNSPGTLSAVSSMVTEQEFGHTEASQETYVQQGVDALRRGAAGAGEQVMESVIIPIAQRVGNQLAMTGMSMAYNAIAGRGGIPGVNSNPNRLSLN